MSDAEQEAGIVARLRRRGEQALAHARELLRSSEWRVDAEEARTGDRVQSAHVAGVGRVFLLTAMYDCTADELWKILCEDIDKLPKWSSLFSKACHLQTLDEQTDVMYHETAGRGAGLISPRDWVSLRHWERRRDSFQSAAVSVDFPLGHDILKRKNVRGETVISLYSVQPDEATARTRLHFLSCCRLGGWLPQSAIERFYVPSYLDFAAHLRKHVRK
ncbi:hypothetical protein R5R35_002690 [Gryllus longicercus]|uniref:START domain-containing protein n=1 Tax=Gryllus longicercus TaxID=2509291 RepID=A0AAN9WNH5_9ORTH